MDAGSELPAFEPGRPADVLALPVAPSGGSVTTSNRLELGSEMERAENPGSELSNLMLSSAHILVPKSWKKD
jgi:hypothetical protein